MTDLSQSNFEREQEARKRQRREHYRWGEVWRFVEDLEPESDRARVRIASEEDGRTLDCELSWWLNGGCWRVPKSRAGAARR